MKTLQEEWRSYRDACYPNGTNARQNKEVHQAFFSGAFVLAILLDAVAELPEEEACVELKKLKDEIKQVLAARISTLKARN